MKRALALLMMGSLVLAGCLHSATVEQIADEEAFELSATEEWSTNTVYADTDFRCDDNSTTSILFVNDGEDDCADGSDENPNGYALISPVLMEAPFHSIRPTTEVPTAPMEVTRLRLLRFTR